MSKLKATKSGKAGKHKGQDTFSTVFVRGMRKGRVMSRTDQRLFNLILQGSNDEQEGALAGKAKKRNIKTTSIVIVRAAPESMPRAPMIKMAAG
jgi:hypothetical protein